jgi:hypothetical protein
MKVQAIMPKWIFTHDPEKYVNDYYAQAAAGLADGNSFNNTNIPPGHVSSMWTMEEVLALEVEGKKIELSGDWS